MGNKQDLSGLKYHKWTVLRKSEKQKRMTLYWCRCECGTEKNVVGATLKNGTSRDCGCGRKEIGRQRFSEPPQEASKRFLLRSYLRSSAKKGHIWDIPDDDFFRLVQQNCYYCGAPPAQIRRRKDSVQNGYFLYNGIDRSNNDVGYTIDNCVPCCARCNYAKRASSQEDFVAWVSRAYHHLFRGPSQC